jgi:hypothetical protein
MAEDARITSRLQGDAEQFRRGLYKAYGAVMRSLDKTPLDYDDWLKIVEEDL